MICHETRDLIHAYLDGELDLVRSLEIERHLPACQSCALMFQNHQALRSAITTGSLYHQAPDDLRRRVRSAARQADQAESKFRLLSWRWLSVGVSLAAAAVLILAFISTWTPYPADGSRTKEVISAHGRSRISKHPVALGTSVRRRH